MIRSKRLQNRITAGRFTLPAAILLSLFCWILTSILLPEVPVIKSSYLLWDTIIDGYIPAWASTPLSFIFYGVVGYFLIELNNTFAIIRMRASVQTAIYFLFISVCPAPASSLCRGLCLDSISYISVLPVQGLPTFPSGRHYVLFVPLYRVG